jgi:monoamine oxidase
MSSRRKFIQNISLASGGFLLANKNYSRFFIAKKPKVIIIGAGFAGLSAAYFLHKKKIDFVILESGKRVGGRVHSHLMDEKENLIVELGAEWVGSSHERLIALCDEMELPLLNNQFDTHLIYRGQYFKKKEWDYSEAWKKKFEWVLKNYEKMTQPDKIKLDKMDWWHYLVNNGCDGRDLDIRELLDSTDFGESIRHVSAFAALAEYAESSEKNEMDFKIQGGNGRLAEKLAETIGADKIKKEHSVEKVLQTAAGVKVYCSNGHIETGDKIICTVPCFAMMKIKWEPVLPPEKLNALNELQYARINKNPMLFSKRFWDDESFDMITDGPGHYFYHATKNQPSAKGVLISYSIGDKADVVSKQSEDWKKNMVAESLLPAFGDIMSLQEKQVNYYWGDNDYSKGAYALYGAGQWFRVMPVLKKSFMHTHFAGEHLADWQGFMEGAVNTGEEAAAKI